MCTAIMALLVHGPRRENFIERKLAFCALGITVALKFAPCVDAISKLDSCKVPLCHVGIGFN